MHIGAFHGDLPILKYFKKRGANIQAVKDQDGRTPLHLAATFNTVDVVKQLVEWGAVVDAKAEVRHRACKRELERPDDTGCGLSEWDTDFLLPHFPFCSRPVGLLC
jgi:hypothetical protein